MKRALTVFTWILGILVGSMVVIAASVIIDRGLGMNRLDPLTNTIIPNGSNPAIRAYVARPQGAGPFPVVIMVHEWWGLKADIISKADALAADGYIVVAPNLFRANTTDWIPTAIWQVSTTPTSQINDDLDAVMLWIRNQPQADGSKVAIIGFCFGGGTAIRYSVDTPEIAATAVFYGATINDPQQLKRVRGPVLGIFGGADNMIPARDVAAFDEGLRQAGVTHEITVYPGEGHAFVKGMDDIARGGNPQKAWQQLRDFLKQALTQQAHTGHVVQLAHQPRPAHAFQPQQLIHQWVCTRTTTTW